ncbi:hypothetical protein CEXT_224121 [Caerostris extrusa]|uniref:Uncharacterized protein n=1 Tax=Caerostris extrusa TaxID=172846 RepID=A0AAV4Y4L4_CAEEX|nr:hypothetical protein CEXT_224121 [Caerostris extrusa]
MGHIREENVASFLSSPVDMLFSCEVIQESDLNPGNEVIQGSDLNSGNKVIQAEGLEVEGELQTLIDAFEDVLGNEKILLISSSQY